MAIQHKVIIIDDDKLAAHNWKILFHFVGEEVSSLNSIQAEKKFIEGLNQEAVLAIMIGSISDKQYSVPAFIQLIHQAHPRLPIFLQGDSTFIQEQVPENSQPWIIQLPAKPDYQTLLRLLDYARHLLGLKPVKTQSKIISE
jgi:DNA-binding NtrC family response regulator